MRKYRWQTRARLHQGRHRPTEKERKRKKVKAKNNRRKKRCKSGTNFRLIRSLNNAEKIRLRGRLSQSFNSYLASKRPKPEIVTVEPTVVEKKKAQIHKGYRPTLKGKKERKARVKIINSRRDKKKELEMRIAKQREKSRVRTENKRMRKEKAREALVEKRKAS